MDERSSANFSSAIPPFFSIILPTYNRHRLVENAIQSVLAQTFDDWELLVIDDGSSDKTFDVVETLILADKRLRYHFAKNRGLAEVRNLGLMMGTGRYFTFLDSDDEYKPEHLAARAEYLKRHTNVELLHGGVEIIGPVVVADKRDPTTRISISECVIGGTFVIRRDLAERLHGFRDLYGDDADFFARADHAGANIQKIDVRTYIYNRMEPDSLCAIVEREGIEGIAKFRNSNG